MWNLRPVAIALGITGLVALASRTVGQPPVVPAKAAERRSAGADNCIRCHDSPRERDKQPGGALELIRLDESTTWEKYDLHGRAYAALTSKLGDQMSELLGYKVKEAPQCLTCHAIDLMPEKKLSEKGLDEFYTKFGVGCEACHGFAWKWERDHTIADWRKKTPAEKEQFGQWDMRDPVKRAERCASCHVGSYPEGRFVTHEMYAAGHPPLPALEVMRHSFDQPYHYNFPKDLKHLRELAAKNPDESWKLFHYRGPSELQTARQVAIGSVVTLRSTAKLLADEAADPKTTVLDLAQFDCAACHHDLEPNSWRQQRGFIGVPGRSQPRPGQAFFARVVAEHAKPGDAANLQAAYGGLTKAFNARPFGVKADVKAAADKVVGWCDAELKQLDSARYSKDATKKLIYAIASSAKAPAGNLKDAWVDFDTAQQLIWAVESLRTEYEAADGPIGKVLAEINTKLPTHVRVAKDQSFIATGLKPRYDRAAEFKPEDLYNTMKKVADLTR